MSPHGLHKTFITQITPLVFSLNKAFRPTLFQPRGKLRNKNFVRILKIGLRKKTHRTIPIHAYKEGSMLAMNLEGPPAIIITILHRGKRPHGGNFVRRLKAPKNKFPL